MATCHGASCACALSQLAQVTHSRHQWKGKAQERGDQDRSLRQQRARVKAERDQAQQALKEAQARLCQLKGQPQAVAVWPKIDVVWLSLRLFVEVRLGFRAVSRVLSLLAPALGIKQAPCAQTLIPWVIRLSSVRLQSARLLQGLPLSRDPLSTGRIWLIASSMGRGPGKMCAVWAMDAPHHHLTPSAPALEHARCIGVAVAESWTGDTMAALLGRLIAQGVYRKNKRPFHLAPSAARLRRRPLLARSAGGSPSTRRQHAAAAHSKAWRGVAQPGHAAQDGVR